MTITSSITNAVVVMVIVVVIVGVVLGLAISGSDLINPKTSAAKQRQMDEQTRYQARINSLREQKLAEEIRIEIEYLKRKAELSLALLPIREYVLIAAGSLALVVVAIGVAIFLTRLGHRWSGLDQQTSRLIADQNGNIWKSRAYRDARIQAARAYETHFREAFPAKPASQDQSVPGDDGRHQEPAPYVANNPGQRQKHLSTPAGVVG